MNQLEGRVAIITGAGRGIGREHALLFAAEGAKVVVNDLDATPAQEVVDEIRAAGGEAVANDDDVADYEGARRIVDQAVDTFGDLHVLVNNAGIVRDRMLVNMTAEEWDAVIGVHLRGHFCPTHWAAAFWRDQHKAGRPGKRAVVNTTSLSGLFGNAGQANYGAAKTGIATFSIIANLELRRYGVRVNAIAPSGATRMVGGRGADPADVSPFVAYLATEDCAVDGKVFFVQGGEVCLFQPFVVVDSLEKQGRWTVEELRAAAQGFAEHRFDYGHRIGEQLLGDSSL